MVKKLIAVHLKNGEYAMWGDRELEQLEFHHPLKDRNYEAGLTTLSSKQIFEEMNKSSCCVQPAIPFSMRTGETVF